MQASATKKDNVAKTYPIVAMFVPIFSRVGRDCLFVLLLDLFGVVKPGRRRRGGFVELGLGHNQE